jgi:hypothetical protein
MAQKPFQAVGIKQLSKRKTAGSNENLKEHGRNVTF